MKYVEKAWHRGSHSAFLLRAADDHREVRVHDNVVQPLSVSESEQVLSSDWGPVDDRQLLRQPICILIEDPIEDVRVRLVRLCLLSGIHCLEANNHIRRRVVTAFDVRYLNIKCVVHTCRSQSYVWYIYTVVDYRLNLYICMLETLAPKVDTCKMGMCDMYYISFLFDLTTTNL